MLASLGFQAAWMSPGYLLEQVEEKGGRGIKVEEGWLLGICGYIPGHRCFFVWGNHTETKSSEEATQAGGAHGRSQGSRNAGEAEARRQKRHANTQKGAEERRVW